MTEINHHTNIGDLEFTRIQVFRIEDAIEWLEGEIDGRLSLLAYEMDAPEYIQVGAMFIVIDVLKKSLEFWTEELENLDASEGVN